MQLPQVPLPTDSIEIAGQAVSFRSLSRAEALQLAEFGVGSEDAAEDFLLSTALGISTEEAHEWRANTDLVTSQPLIEAIAALSGLSIDPKVLKGNSLNSPLKSLTSA